MSNYKLTDNEMRVIETIKESLPTDLTGTEKQIAYARDIIRRTAELAGEVTFGPATRKSQDINAMCAQLSAGIKGSRMLQVSSAKRWIDASAAHNGTHVDIGAIMRGIETL